MHGETVKFPSAFVDSLQDFMQVINARDMEHLKAV
jgi:hypothetical protein